MAPKREKQLEALATSLKARAASPADAATPPDPKVPKKSKRGAPENSPVETPTSGGESVRPKRVKKTLPAEPSAGATEPPFVPPEETPKTKQTKQKTAPTDSVAEPAKRTKGKAFDPKFTAENAPEATWANHAKIMKHFELSEAEATAVLLDVCGPDPSGEKFWSSFKTPNPDTMETQEIPKDVQGVTEKVPDVSEESLPDNFLDDLDAAIIDGVELDEEELPLFVNGFDMSDVSKSTALCSQPEAPKEIKSTVKSVATPQVWFPKM